MMWNSYISETSLVDTAAKEIGERLPPRWLLLDREREAAVRSPQESARMIDAIWELRDPDGLSSDIIVEVKANPVEPRLVRSVASQLKALSRSMYEQAEATPAYMVVSSYLSPLTRERLAEAGIGYADSTGNVRFTIDRPAVYIETQGADKNPFREDRPLRSLKGGRAARVARGLLDYRTPFGTREARWRDRKLCGHDFEGIQSTGAGRDSHQGEPERKLRLGGLGGLGPPMGHGLRLHLFQHPDDLA